MKPLIPFTVCICLLTFIQSCKKNDQPGQLVNVTIKANTSYQYDLGYFGREEGAGISKQALHYAVSKTERTNKVIYSYTPAPNFTGTDEVELTSGRGSDGASTNTDITVTTIKFTITN